MGSGFHAFKQTHILNRDHCLVGKCLDQLDLLLVNGLTLRAGQRQNADRTTLAQQRHAEIVRKPPNRCDLAEGVFTIGSHIGDLNNLAFEKARARGRPSSRVNGLALSHTP